MENKQLQELLDTIVDTELRSMAKNLAEFEERVWGSQALKQQLEKQTERNCSFVQESIALRSQVRKLKTPSFTILPPTSSFRQVTDKTDSALPLLSSEKTNVPL
jgi:hypothetical protein